MREAVLDEPLALGVEVARRLVQDQDPRIGEQGPGDRDPLPLPAAELDAPLADHRLVAAVESGDELVGVGEASGVLDLVLGGIVLRVADVLRHRPVEEEDVLLDDAQKPPVALDLDLAEIPSVELDQPPLGS